MHENIQFLKVVVLLQENYYFSGSEGFESMEKQKKINPKRKEKADQEKTSPISVLGGFEKGFGRGVEGFVEYKDELEEKLENK